VHRSDVEWFEGAFREVPEVERDQYLDVRAHRSGKHVSVLRVVRHPSDQLVVALDFGVRERVAHAIEPMCDLRGGHLGLARQYSAQLLQNAG
jgi:hypothetical protein